MPIIITAPQSTAATIMVQQIQGPAGSAGISVGTPGQFLVTNLADTGTQWVTLSGDASNSVSVLGQVTVTGLQGHPVAATAPTSGYVLSWSGTAWTPTAPAGLITLAGDATGPAGSNTVVALQGHAVASTAPVTGDALVWSGTSWGPGTVAASGVTPGTAGQIFVSNSTPAAVWTSLISYETTHGRFTAGGSGTDFKTVVGPLVGSETAFGAVWVLPTATAATVSNPVLYSDGASAFVNTPSPSGVVNFVFQGSTIFGRLANNTGTIDALWLGHGASFSSSNMAFMADAATFAGFNAPTAGQIRFIENNTTLRAKIDLDHGRGTFGGGGTDYKAILGPLVGSETAAAALYLLPGATAASGSNYSITANSGSLYFVSPGPGTGAIRTTSTGMVFSDNAGGALTINVNSGAGTNLEFSAGVTPSIVQDAAGSDVAAKNLTLSPQAPYSAASVNKFPGSVVVAVPATVGGAVQEGGFLVDYSSIHQVRMGAYNDGVTYGAIWFHDGGSPTTSNFSFLGSSADTYFNAPSGGMYFGVGASYHMQMTSAVLNIGSLYASPQYVFDFNAAALLHFGVAATSAGITYNAKTSDVATADFIITGQAPYSAAVTNLTAGDVIINVPPSVGAGSKYGGLMVRAGTGSPKNMVEIGPYAFGTANPADGAIWFSTAVPGAANYSFLGDGANSVVNAPSGFLALRVANTTYANLTSTSMTVNASTFGVYNSAGSFGFQMFAGASWLATWAASSTSVGFTHTAAASDVATANITITPQAPFSAAVTNRTAGDVVVNVPASVGAGIKYGGFVVEYNGTPSVRIGGHNNNTYGAIYFLDGGSPTTTNIALVGDGSTFTGINAPRSTAMLQFLAGGSNTLGMWTTNGLQVFGTSVSFGGGTGVIGIHDASVTPTSNATSGGVLYSEGGALKWRGSSGTVTTLGAA